MNVINAPEAENPLYSNANNVEFTVVPGSVHPEHRSPTTERVPDYSLEMGIEVLDDRYNSVLAGVITQAMQDARGELIVDDSGILASEAQINGQIRRMETPSNDVLANLVNRIIPRRNN